MTVSADDRPPSMVIHHVRPVPVRTPAPPGPVDLRISGGVVTEVAPALRPEPHDEVLDAAGRWAIPGLWDQHVHLGQQSQARRRLDLRGTGSPADVLDRVRAHLDTRPGAADVLVGLGYRSAAWAEQPTVAALDAVTGEHPVVLVSGDVHNGWLNSAALRRFGLPPRTDPLHETEWFTVFARLPELPEIRSTLTDAYSDAVRAAAALGVVGVVDLEMEPGYASWPERYAAGVDLLRVRTATYPDRLQEVVGARLRSGDPLSGGTGLLTMGPLKIISDGSLNTRTASCCEPYPPDGPEPTYGTQNYPRAELVGLLTRARAAGLDVALHAIGDAAAEVALEAFAATGARGGLEHAQLLRPAQIARMAALGVRASVQPAHLLDDRDVTAQLWPDRADRCFPLRSLLGAGVELVLGSDAPVSPLDPWLAMAAAAHRSADEREPWNPAEAITVAEALAASTDGQPTLAAGSRGDLVLLDADPLAPHPTSAEVARHLQAMPVAATVVAGRPTHLAL